MKQAVVLGLSGGVDSAVSAALLQKTYTVHGLYLDIGLGDQARADAEAVARQLGISFSVQDIRSELETHVCAPFAAAYQIGKTPIPCAVCNPMVKFPALLKKAAELGADWVATGHYANLTHMPDGRVFLRQGKTRNDQAYLLARLPEELLAHILFPLGDYEKPQVRALAESLGLSVAAKPDSMDICFVPDGNYASWMQRRGPVPPPGFFVDEAGNILGRHKGIHHYTLGQRRGLHIAMGYRVFVSKIDPETNQITLSEGSGLLATQVFCQTPNWIGMAPPEAPIHVAVKLRHTKQTLPARLTQQDDIIHLALETPARAPTPGQMAVFYEEDRILGSAWIASSK